MRRRDNVRKVIFRRNDENQVVLEKDNFKDSLFQEQYLSAMHSFIDVCNAMNRDSLSVSNVVAFCGDRGEGKSSCMQTTRKVLMNPNHFHPVDIEHLDMHEKQYLTYVKAIEQYHTYALKVIDPSFFDETHNILDLVISQLYQEAFDGEDNEEETKESYKARYQLIRCFDRVKESMSLLEKNRREIFDNIESLDRLAESMKLRENVHKLFDEFLQYRNKHEESAEYKKILICIDDLDLNVNGGYTMLEQIRKYLSNPNCVILMALKIEQMTKVVQNALYVNSGHNQDIISNEMCRDMAEKYITKLFPTEHRIQMPKVEDIVDYPLELHYAFDSQDVTAKPETWTSIKEAVVSLIFLKTRYLFYNKETEVNLIIPRNLRSLRQLVAMLLKMDDFVKGSDISKENQTAFKKYFFNEWTNILPEEQKELVNNIINYNDVSTKNHYVLTSLLQPRLLGADTGLFDWFNARVRAYNVSVGDVLYAIQYLQETGHADLRELLFFLRSYYSICLYDYYDELVGEVKNAESIPAIYGYQKYYWNGNEVVEREEVSDKHVEIYAYDERFRRISRLQQIVGGAYYMYEPGELLPEESVNIRDQYTKRLLFSSMPRDYRALDGIAIFDFMQENGRTNLSKTQIVLDDSKLLYFQMCEFFALTTKMIQTADESRNGNYRYRYYPYYLTSFKRENTIVLFDVMAIFSNIINVAYAYNRFNEALWGNGTKQSFFEIALKQEGSLLNQLLASYKEDADKNGYKDPLHSAYTLGRFASAGIIRNVDVHESLLAKVKAEKESLSKNATSGSDSIGRLIDFYRTIRNSEITLYGGADAKLGELYTVNYEKLLDPIINFLRAIKKKTPDTFKDLFTTYEERVHSFKQGFKLVGGEVVREGKFNIESDAQVQWPQSIDGVDTSYLSTIYGEISEIDWSQQRDGKFVKDHMSSASRGALVYPINSSITSRQTYKSAEEFMQKLIEIIRKNSDRLRK